MKSVFWDELDLCLGLGRDHDCSFVKEAEFRVELDLWLGFGRDQDVEDLSFFKKSEF